MKNITQFIFTLFMCMSMSSFAQGTLVVTGNGQSISNPDTTPSSSDNTNFNDVGTTASKQNTFVLDNTANGGSAANRLDNINVSINNTTDFALSATSLGSLYGNSGTINLNITFTPSSTGVKTAIVTITFSNGTAGNSPYVFHIQGNGILLPADINIRGNGVSITNGDTSPSTTDHTSFGNVNNGASLSRIFTVENVGGQDLTNISSVSLTNNAEFQVKTNISGTPLTLSPGNSTTFEIEFTPSTVNSFTDVVTITSDDADESTYTFTISGTGITPPLVEAGAIWKYLDNGSDQGTAWRAIAFNDATWSSGAAELGYGDGDETTDIGAPANPKPFTTYFRHSFNIADASAYSSLDLQLEAIRDDGMVVYLNGNEVWRDNISGTVTYTTPAAGNISGAAESTWLSTLISANQLVTGTNVVAVEIHQDLDTSSDISFNFKMTPVAKVPVSTLRGPYLNCGTPSSIVIKWRTNKATQSIVNYGTSLGSLNSNVTDNTATTEHEVTITGLLPNTKYYYDIADGDGVYVSENSEMYVVTAPTMGSDQFVRAWILGDAGTANQNQRDVRDQYYNYVSTASTNPNQTDMMLFLGDNAYNSGTENEYQLAFFDIYNDMLKKSVSWSTLGNHDGYSANSNTQSGPYYDIFTFPTAAEAGGLASGTEAYYSFDYANIHFIVLESYTLSTDAAQMTWCLNDIQATTQDWIVAIFHHPPYTKGSHNSDTESPLINMRNNFLPILEDNGVDLVLSGHSHSYERSFFINGHYGISDSFDSVTMTVGTNGDLSGKADTADGAYSKSNTDTDGAVYITTGSAGKISGGTLDHEAMYASLNQLGSCVLELENSGGDQDLTVKFLTNTGSVTDYFTIHKTGVTLSLDNKSISEQIKLFPVPANNLLNIKVNSDETIGSIKFYDVVGKMVKETKDQSINVSNMRSGMYVVKITTDKNEYFKNIIIK